MYPEKALLLDPVCIIKPICFSPNILLCVSFVRWPEPSWTVLDSAELAPAQPPTCGSFGCNSVLWAPVPSSHLEIVSVGPNSRINHCFLYFLSGHELLIPLPVSPVLASQLPQVNHSRTDPKLWVVPHSELYDKLSIKHVSASAILYCHY